MVSAAAQKWASKVFAKRPVTVEFVQVPPDCSRFGCGGYHPTVCVRIDEDGRIFLSRPYGYHALAVGDREVLSGEDVEHLAELGYRLLRWARQVDPWAVYPPAGWREDEEGYIEDVWF
jgi:hypothetical protein